MSATFPGLQALPVEIIIKICTFLDLAGLFSATQTNRFLHNVIESTPELQYVAVLQTAGKVDGITALDTRRKVEELIRSEEAWRRLDLSRKVTVKVPHNASHIYDLTGGVYLLGDCRTFTFSRETASLRFFDLTTCVSGPATRTESWRELGIDDHIVDVGFSLREHDLLGIVALRKDTPNPMDSIVLHLREFSTGGPHPLAKLPEITVARSQQTWRKLSIMIEIVGPCLLLLLTWRLPTPMSDARDVLMLINWWSGEIIKVEAAPHRTWDNFVFLSSSLVLLPNAPARSLDIIQLPDVLQKPDSNSVAKPFTREATLDLPQMHDLCSITSITCRSDPNPFGAQHPKFAGAPQGSGGWKGTRERPYNDDPENAIILLQFLIREFQTVQGLGHWPAHWHRLHLIVHRSSILKFVNSYKPKPRMHTSVANGSDEEEAEVDERENENTEVISATPWCEWAPDIARWCLGEEANSVWITTTAGQRFVGLTPERARERFVVVKDFNTYAVKKAREAMRRRRRYLSIGARTYEGQDKAEPDFIVIDKVEKSETSLLQSVFKEDAECNLPYVETISDESYDLHGVLIDGEYIIGLRHDLDSGAVVEFDVFVM